jgi:hypothetical protein
VWKLCRERGKLVEHEWRVKWSKNLVRNSNGNGVRFRSREEKETEERREQ